MRSIAAEHPWPHSLRTPAPIPGMQIQIRLMIGGGQF